MATPDLRQILRLPGTLVAAPTNVALAYPYGGTVLGYAREVSCEFLTRYVPYIAEEWSHRVETLVSDVTPRIVAVLRGFDADAVAKFWSAAAIANGEYRLTPPTPGTLVTTFALLFCPNDTTAPAVYFPRAIPQLEATARLSLALNADAEVGVVFEAAHHASKSPYQIAPVGGITL